MSLILDKKAEPLSFRLCLTLVSNQINSPGKEEAPNYDLKGPRPGLRRCCCLSRTWANIDTQINEIDTNVGEHFRYGIYFFSLFVNKDFKYHLNR